MTVSKSADLPGKGSGVSARNYYRVILALAISGLAELASLFLYNLCFLV